MSWWNVLMIIVGVRIGDVLYYYIRQWQKKKRTKDFYSAIELRMPCNGKNSNVCVGEGCYDKECVRKK